MQTLPYSLFDSLIDGAILDVLLEEGATSLAVARELERRRVAFVFYTGQPDAYLRPVRDELPQSIIIAKLAEFTVVLAAIASLMPQRHHHHAAQIAALGGAPVHP